MATIDTDQQLERWKMCMAEAGWPIDVVAGGDEKHWRGNWHASEPKAKIFAAWRAHQIVGTSAATDHPDFEDYLAWWKSVNPWTEIV